MSRRCPLVVLAGLCWLGLLLALAPAQDGKSKGAAVSGKITLDGQPVTKGKITFHPEKGKSAGAAIFADGAYTVRDVPPGKHKVTIEADRVPKDFADVKTTPLTIEVQQKDTLFDFELRK